MKIAYYKYDKTGQNVIKKHSEVKEIFNNIYLTNIPDGGGNLDIVHKWENNGKEVYIKTSCFCEKYDDEKDSFFNNYKTCQEVFKSLQTQFPRLLEITAFRELGFNVENLIEKRKKYFEEKEQREKEQREKEQREKDEKEQEEKDEIKNMEENEKKFKSGEFIEGEYFIKLCKKYGIPIYPRTIGVMRSRIKCVCKDGRLIVIDNRNRYKAFNGVAFAISKLNYFFG